MALSLWWIRSTRTASAVGVAVFAVVIVAARPESELQAFFDVWVYCGLMVTAWIVAGSRALFVSRERLAWAAITLGLTSWTFGEIWYAATHPESYPSMADYGFLGFYPFVYIGIVLLLRSQARVWAEPSGSTE